MLDLDLSQLPSEMTALFMQRGSGLPPLHWPSYANRIAKATLDEIDDAKLLRRPDLADQGMGAAVRALLYLWNGWPDDCKMQAQAAPEKERIYLDSLAARQADEAEQAKTLLQHLDTHPVYKPLAAYAMNIISDKADPILSRFKQMVQMADLWEPFLFVDLYQQARAEKVRETTEHVVRQLQCMEFELLFRHCYEAATGEPLSKPSDRSASSDQESGIARVRRLRDRHRPKHRTSDRAASDRSKSKDSKAAAESPGQIAVVCPKCRKSLTLPDSARGKNQRCGKCSAIFTVPGKKGPGGPKASPAAARTIAVRCPKCGSTLKAPESARGRTERCAKCGARFMIPKKPAGGVPAAAGKA